MGIEHVINEVAADLGINPVHLTKLISFESNFDPLAKNPFSSARGLIQFTDTTARDMGFFSADDLVQKFPTAEAQLRGPVLKYLSQFQPFGSPYPQSLYMSVFYPKARYAAPDTAFSDSIRKVNPGINFVSDYVAKVEKKKGKIATIKKYSFIGFLFPVAALSILVFKNYLRSVSNGE